MSTNASWLDSYFGPAQFQDEGVDLPIRNKVNITGVDIFVADDPLTKKTTITVNGAAPIGNAATGTLNDVVTTTGGVPVSSVRFSGAAPVVNGLANGSDGRRLVLITTGGPLVLANENASSVAANRIITGTGGDLTIDDEKAALLVYDGSSLRWRVVAGGSGGAAVVEVAPIANAGTGTLNDVVTTSAGLNATGVRFSGAAPTVTGLASGSSGRRLVIFATGGPVVIAHENAGSTASNRIVTSSGADATIDNGAAALLVYDGTSSRWRLAEEESQLLANSGTGALNDVATTNASGNRVAVLRFDGAAPTINGLASGVSGRRLYVITTGGSLVLANEAAGSTPANRIITGTGADVTIADEETAELVYDGTSSRWRMLRVGTGGGGGGGSPGGSTNDVQIKAGASTFGGVSPGATGTVLRSTGTGAAPAFGALDLANASAVSGNLPITNIAPGSALQYLRRNSGNTANEWSTPSWVNADIATGAAISGTKISPDFGSQNILTTGNAQLGSGVSTLGIVRVPYQASAAVILGGKAGAGTNDQIIGQSGFNLYFGEITPANFTTNISGDPMNVWGKSAINFYIGAGGAAAFKINSTQFLSSLPRLGDATPYASEGEVTIALSGPVTLTSGQYNRAFFKFTGPHAATDTITLPAPASQDASYRKRFRNTSTNTDLLFTTGTGTTRSFPAPGAGTEVYGEIHVTPDGVFGWGVRASTLANV